MLIPLLLVLIALYLPLHGMKKNNCLVKLRTNTTFSEPNNSSSFTVDYDKILDLQEELTHVNQQFTDYKNRLNEERNEHLLQLKNFHGISDIVWATGMKRLEFIKKNIKNRINTMLPDATHDSIIAGKNKLFFAERLKKYGLNIKKIYIEKKNTPSDELPSFLRIETRNKIETIHVKQPRIIVSSVQFNQMSPIQQRATLSKYAWVMANVSLISSAFVSFIANNTKKQYTFKSLQYSKEYQFFLMLECQQYAEIFPCLEDYQTCRLIKNLRKSVLSSPVNLEQHKQNFQRICFLQKLWKTRHLLEQLAQQ